MKTRPFAPLVLRLSVLWALTLFGCGGPAQGPASDAADLYFFGGDILTMAGEEPTYVEALLVKEGKIVFAGSQAEALKQVGDSTESVDLQGKTLLPGFLDAHSHYISSLTVANQVNVYAPPAGPGADVPSIVQAIADHIEKNAIPEGSIVQAYGYDENVMPEGKLLNRDDLDAAFPNHIVVVGHVSMHGGVLNSMALNKWGYSAKTETAPGGVIVRKPGTNEPYGLIMEISYEPVHKNLPKPQTPEEEIAWSKAGQMLYAQQGITTAHEGATFSHELAVMKRVSEAGENLIDLIAYPFITDLDASLALIPRDQWLTYHNGLKVGGVKITIDGSPQGKTAMFSTPYLTGGPGGEKEWKGEPTFPQETIEQMVKRVYDLGVPLNLHANGDGAIDAFFKAHEKAAADDLEKERHVTLIHAQFTRKDQLDQYVRYKVLPSFYTLHTYYFADAHKTNRGPEQAAYISPMADAWAKGIRPTNHTDFYVAPLDQMFMLWSAVNRISRSGEVIGPDQRISAYQGLQTMTINVARQYQEESNKGTLEVGKLADLVVLDQNPVKVDPEAIKDIKVVQTLKEGKTIYRRP